MLSRLNESEHLTNKRALQFLLQNVNELEIQGLRG